MPFKEHVAFKVLKGQFSILEASIRYGVPVAVIAEWVNDLRRLIQVN